MLTEILFSLLAISFLWILCRKPSNYPPGPWGLPLIGYIPLVKRMGHDFYSKLNKEYGDVVSWRIGTHLVVFIFDSKIIKEAFTGPKFVDRPNLKVFQFIDGGNTNGLISSNGSHWHSLRRFSIRHLRDLGMGKSSFSSAVQHEAMEFANELKRQAGKPAEIPSCLIISVLNVVWQLTANKRFSFEDKKIIEYKDLLTSMLKNSGAMIVPDIFPWIKYVVPHFIRKNIFGEELRLTLTNKLSAFLKEAIFEHMDSLDCNNPRDYIDDYLIEMESKKDDPSSTMSIEDLTFCLADLFVGGTETTTTSLMWTIVILASHPQVQMRLQKEIDNVLPQGSPVTLEDKSKMPYLEAFIHELLRFSSFSQFAGIHMATEDSMLGGYFIPKNAMVAAVGVTSHFNPLHFDSPNEFRPERFINADGKFESPKEGFMPFGIGRRQCLGETLARMELLVFITTIVQHVSFSAPPGKTVDINQTPWNPFIRYPNEDQDFVINIR